MEMIIPILIAIIGSTIAGIWDLFTTDIPDEVTDTMIIFGIFYWIFESLKLETPVPILMSAAIGFVFFIFGYAMYKTGQWGGGDAKLLVAIGVLLPFYKNAMFPLAFLINVFVVGALYTIIYSIIIGIWTNSIAKFFRETPRFVEFLSLAMMILAIFLPKQPGIIVFLTGFLLIFWYYAKFIEKNLFVKKIPASKLKVGDVLYASKEWVGITEEELRKLKKSKKTVTIKEGIRFGPVFLFALLFTLIYGNLLFLFFTI